MRRFWGAIAVLIVTVVMAQGQSPTESSRAASLKAPEPLPAEDLPPVARGAAPEFPITAGGSLPSTPVKRAEATLGPSWISGVDPNLLPVAGKNVRPNPAGQRTLPNPTGFGPSTPAVAGRPTTGLVPASLPAPARWVDRILPPADQPPAPSFRPPAATTTPKDPPSATTAFRAVGNNGAAVYAGPPAYRWYGWGTVTPGTNPLAPNGQYPRASANWYQITGATPGAFPVPVTSSGQPWPGIDPPSYGTARSVGSLPPSPLPRTQTYSIQQFMETATTIEPPRKPAAEESKFAPNITIPAAPPAAPTPPPARIPVPTITPVSPTTSATTAVQPLPVPTDAGRAPRITPNSLASPIVPSPWPEPKTNTNPPPASGVAVPPPEPNKPTSSSAGPQPLPTSLTTNPAPMELDWRPAAERSVPGQWVPAPGVQPLPTQTLPSPTLPAQEPAPTRPTQEPAVRPVLPPTPTPLPTQPVQPLGNEAPTPWKASSTSPVARGQVNDPQPDPIVALIQQLCLGRARSVEVRWMGTKKLSVCFEAPTAVEAKRLVDTISQQRELTPYHIDFCIVVK
ncbi:MAG: hypothetical protein NZS48_16605 [Gemmata sp.]|nr:hypothetical protein [Gemmata sp.]